MLNSNARLVSIIRRLPISQQSPRLLNIGCGAFVEAPALRKLLPGWAVIGLDIVRLKKKFHLARSGRRRPFTFCLQVWPDFGPPSRREQVSGTLENHLRKSPGLS